MSNIIRAIPLPSAQAVARDERQEKRTKRAKIGFAIFMLLAMLLLIFTFLYIFVIKKSGTSLLMPGVAGAGILLLIGTKLFGNRVFHADERGREAAVRRAILQQDELTAKLLADLPESYIVFRNLTVPASTGSNEKRLLETVILGESGVTVLHVRTDRGHLQGRMENDTFRRAAEGKSDARTVRNPVRTLRPMMLSLQEYLSANGFRMMVRGVAAYTDPSVKLEITGSDPVSDIHLFACGNGDRKELNEYLTEGIVRLPPQTVRSLTELLRIAH